MKRNFIRLSAALATACVLAFAPGVAYTDVVPDFIESVAYADDSASAAPASAAASAEPGSGSAVTDPQPPETDSADPGTAALDASGSAALTATGTPAAEGDIPVPEMTNEEAIEAVKFGIQLLKDGSYAAGLAVIWLVLLFGFGKFIYPRVKGLMSNKVQNVVVAAASFTSILAVAITQGLAWYLGLVPALLGSGLATAIWVAVQKKNADDEA